MNSVLLTCTCTIHNYSGSTHLKTKVPIELFKHEDSDKLFKTCIDCRKYNRNYKNKVAENEKQHQPINNNNGLMTCTNRDHNCNGSFYLKNNVPIELFKDETSEKLFLQCIDCRKHNRIRNNRNFNKIKNEKNEKYEEAIKNNDEYIPCLYKHHNNKIYHNSKVPRKLFVIENTDNLTKYCLNCLNCINHKTSHPKIKEINNNSSNPKIKEIDDKCERMSCLAKNHDDTLYPKFSVPIIFFMKYPYIPNSPLTRYCIYCREKLVEKDREDFKIYSLEAEKKGLFFCSYCCRKIEHSKRGINTDGTLSTYCVHCYDKTREKAKISKKNFEKLKHEYVEKYQSCCYLCNKIYIYDDDILTSIDTILKGDTRYIEYNNMLYSVSDFINKYSDIINVDMLHFDHLSEKEQRERGIIGPDEMFLAKADSVGRIINETRMRFEASKCQLLCGKCHVIETIRREDEKRIEKTGTVNQKKHVNNKAKKRDYVNELKKQGCCLCGHVDINLLRFFHFDHTNPSSKIDNITTMVSGKYTFEQLVDEIKKCRIVCLHCHMIHTKIQHNDGIFRVKEEPKLRRDLFVAIIKVNQYDKNYVFIKQYASMAETVRSCNITINTLHKLLDNKIKHPSYIFERA